jgi:hypothetical protein
MALPGLRLQNKYRGVIMIRIASVVVYVALVFASFAHAASLPTLIDGSSGDIVVDIPRARDIAHQSVVFSRSDSSAHVVYLRAADGETFYDIARGASIVALAPGGALELGSDGVRLQVESLKNASAVYRIAGLAETPEVVATALLPGLIDATPHDHAQSRHNASLRGALTMLRQSADMPSTPLYVAPADGSYRFLCEIAIMQPVQAGESSVLPTCDVQWTDPDADPTPVVIPVMGPTQEKQIGAMGRGAGYNGVAVIRAKAGTPIAIATTGYTSTGAAPMLYSLRASLEYLAP